MPHLLQQRKLHSAQKHVESDTRVTHGPRTWPVNVVQQQVQLPAWGFTADQGQQLTVAVALAAAVRERAGHGLQHLQSAGRGMAGQHSTARQHCRN